MLCRIASLGVFILLASPALAVNIGKLIHNDPALVLNSAKGIYDVQRCIVESDQIGVASVIAYPDRPNYVLLAFSGGVGVGYAIQLYGSAAGTKIQIHTQKIFVDKGRITRPFADCIQ